MRQHKAPALSSIDQKILCMLSHTTLICVKSSEITKEIVRKSGSTIALEKKKVSSHIPSNELDQKLTKMGYSSRLHFTMLSVIRAIKWLR